jgi:hypothetical protein
VARKARVSPPRTRRRGVHTSPDRAARRSRPPPRHAEVHILEPSVVDQQRTDPDEHHVEADRRRSHVEALEAGILPLGTVVSLKRSLRASSIAFLANRRRRCLHRNTVRRPAGRRLVVVAQMSGWLSWRGLPVRISVSVHASGVSCPVSAWAMSARPVSGCRVSIGRGVRRRCPRVPRPHPRRLCPHR